MVIPLNPDELTYTEKRQALEDVNISKEKINRIIKGITCEKLEQSNEIFLRGRKCGITKGITKGIINHACD